MRWPSARLRTSASPLTRNSSGITYHGPIEDAAVLDGAPEPRLLLGPDLEVVLEHDRLAVEMEVRVGRIGVEQIEQPIDQRHEPEAELLVGQIPLAIPVRVRNDVNVDHLPFDRAGGEAGDEEALQQDERRHDRHQRR